MKPSEYFARNCWVGVSFPSPVEAEARHDIGIDRFMWGSDYPHDESTYPHTREALRRAFAGAPENELTTGARRETRLGCTTSTSPACGPSPIASVRPLRSSPFPTTAGCPREIALPRSFGREQLRPSSGRHDQFDARADQQPDSGQPSSFQGTTGHRDRSQPRHRSRRCAPPRGGGGGCGDHGADSGSPPNPRGLVARDGEPT